MLKIDPHQTFEATARINLKALQASFGIMCRLIDIDELEALRQKWVGQPAVGDTPAVAPTITDREFIDAWLVGFAADVMDMAGNPLPFTPENVTALLKKPGGKIAVIDAFFSGYEEAETKNSGPLRAGS